MTYLIDQLSPYSLTDLLLTSSIVFIAGIIRGFSGFGLALVAVPLMTLYLEPYQVTPCMYLYAVASSLHLMPKIRKEVDFNALRPLLTGFIIGFPLGMTVLRTFPADMMRIVIALIVLLVVLGLWKTPHLHKKPRRIYMYLTGTISGLMGGGTGMDGPPIVIYFLSIPNKHRVGRASLIAYFIASGSLSIGIAATSGLITRSTLMLAALTIPALLIGNSLGDRFFNKAAADTYRKIALLLLTAVASMALIKAIM